LFFCSHVHPQHPALLLHPDYAATVVGSNSTESAMDTMASVTSNGGKRQLKVDLEGEEQEEDETRSQGSHKLQLEYGSHLLHPLIRQQMALY
jgi:hypothetical protein